MEKRRRLVSLLLTWVALLFLAILLWFSPGQASDGSNLLLNPGFEEGTDHWLYGPSAATFVVTETLEYVHSGTRAASLNRTDGVTGQIYISQDVDVVGGAFYTLTGWAYKDSPNFQSVYLRIEWRDAALQKVGEVDSHLLTDNEDVYHLLCVPRECDSTGEQAPNNAVKARIKGIGDIGSPNPETPVFFDDLSFTFQGSKVYLPLVVKNY